ncbi:hypothetical protein SteCoe_30261 [Stentor coeruleus]|uniref:Uncharacterized protein n=1 Tax=Stentor coeruleus TaxID=5963 RepID=A0A1R2B424_9CILI|nr:hypothetical protein SteCoe_30261 [Stentor coeruleus]
MGTCACVSAPKNQMSKRKVISNDEIYEIYRNSYINKKQSEILMKEEAAVIIEMKKQAQVPILTLEKNSLFLSRMIYNPTACATRLPSLLK